MSINCVQLECEYVYKLHSIKPHKTSVGEIMQSLFAIRIRTSTVVILGPEIEDPALSQVKDSHVDSGKKFMIWLNKGDNLLERLACTDSHALVSMIFFS